MIELLAENLGMSLLQAVIMLLFAPLIAGIINKVKAQLNKRQGASIFQE